MKIIGLVVLLQVGTVLSLPFIGSSNSESSVDFITSCFSSGDYDELQNDVAAGLWSYEKGDVNSAKKTLKEYPAFEIVVTLNFSDGGLPDFHYSLSTEVLQGVSPGICISSATEVREGVISSMVNAVSSWIWESKNTSSSTAPAPLLKVLKVERYLNIGQELNELWNQWAEGSGSSSFILRTLKFMESIKNVVTASTTELVFHVIPPFPETVRKGGPILAATIEEMKNSPLRSEVRNAIVFTELVGRVIVPQLLLEATPALCQYSYADRMLPLNIRKKAIFGLQKLITHGLLPILGNHISGNNDFVTQVFAPVMKNDVVTDVTDFMMDTADSLGGIASSMFPFITPARLGVKILSVFM
ncbi:hypothetical protein Pcinc_031146 [Petrolisthes cinctipes]|uniref:Uncharacterized protein n=1 Tax=Petrolisthes cinctipes TaxID=88211 RepID=A0AAE1EXS9_PETCI|nr:hypothetical protein Pcinc_031146 [Petrolisthes cinctipes]